MKMSQKVHYLGPSCSCGYFTTNYNKFKLLFYEEKKKRKLTHLLEEREKKKKENLI